MRNQLITTIKELSNQSFARTIKTFENFVSEFIVNEGASDEEISICDSYFGFKLPEDYKSFLKEFDGSVFFKIEDFAGFKFLGCVDIVKENKFQKENLGEDWDNQIIIFCACLGDGDYVGIKLLGDNSYEIVDCFMDEMPANWQALGNSIDEFIEKLINEKGRKFWLND